MAKGRGLWLFIIAATLYLPFQEFLRAREYTSADEFFEDLLVWVVLGGMVIVPLVVILSLTKRKRTRQEKRVEARKAEAVSNAARPRTQGRAQQAKRAARG